MRHRPLLRRVALAFGMIAGLVAPLAASAETVMERAARTGELSLGGPSELPPYSVVVGGQRVGLSLDVANRIAAEVSAYLGKPIKVVYDSVVDPAVLFRQVSRGDLDLSCGAQFTWEREMFVDYTLPFSLSGIRVLTRSGRLDGTAASLAGKRIGVVPGSLGAAALASLQPKAVAVPQATLEAAVAALVAGKLDGVAGDSIVLAASLPRDAAKGYALVPGEAYARYAVGCILPENNSTFRNLANVAIAKLLQGYLQGEASAVATVDRWLGPRSALQLPPEVIKAYFETVLLTHEQIRLTTPSAAAAGAPSAN